MSTGGSASARLQARLEEFLLGANHDITKTRWVSSFASKHREHPLLGKLYRQIEREWERREQSVRQSIRAETNALRPRRRLHGRLTIDDAVSVLEQHEQYLLKAQNSLMADIEARIASIAAIDKDLARSFGSSKSSEKIAVDDKAATALSEALAKTAPPS